MGFWIFMLIVNMIIPITMIGFGTLFVKQAPKEINPLFGYRTKRSMKNKDTWNFAHHYCGKLWRIIGWIILACSIIAMLVVVKQDMKFVSIYGGIISGVQCLFLIAPIFPTETALKKNFDSNGNPKI